RRLRPRWERVATRHRAFEAGDRREHRSTLRATAPTLRIARSSARSWSRRCPRSTGSTRSCRFPGWTRCSSGRAISRCRWGLLPALTSRSIVGAWRVCPRCAGSTAWCPASLAEVPSFWPDGVGPATRCWRRHPTWSCSGGQPQRCSTQGEDEAADCRAVAPDGQQPRARPGRAGAGRPATDGAEPPRGRAAPPPRLRTSHLSTHPSVGVSPRQELHLLTVAEAGRRFRDGSLTSSDYVSALMERIRRLDPQLRSVIAIAGAPDVDIESWQGPLHGIPIGIKDSIATAGIRTTANSRVLSDWVPAEDAPSVAALRAAGAIVLAKLNLNEF